MLPKQRLCTARQKYAPGAGVAEMEASGLVLKSPTGSPLASISRGRGILVKAIRALALLGLALYAAHSIAGLGGHGLDKLFEDWVFNWLLLASAALCLMRAAWCRAERRAWLALGIGLGCWAAGEILFTVDPGQVTEGSFPAPSDFLWLVFYPASFVTLGLLVRSRVRVFYASLWLDGIVGALAIAALASQ